MQEITNFVTAITYFVVPLGNPLVVFVVLGPVLPTSVSASTVNTTELITLTTFLFVCEHISFLSCSPLSDLVWCEVEHGHSVVDDREWPWSSPGESEGSQVSHCHWGSYRRTWWTCMEYQWYGLSILNSTWILPCTTNMQTLSGVMHEVVLGISGAHSTNVFLSVFASTDTVVGSLKSIVTFSRIVPLVAVSACWPGLSENSTVTCTSGPVQGHVKLKLVPGVTTRVIVEAREVLLSECVLL